MAATGRIRSLGPLAAAGLLGALTPVLPPAAIALVVAALVLWLASVLVGYRFESARSQAWHPVLLVLTAFAVFTVAWNGFPPKAVAAPDIVLVVALFTVGYCWLQDRLPVPMPGWLLGTAAILIASQLLNQFFFVPHPPQDPPPSFTPIGPALVTMAKVELGMLVVPIVIGAVASSWRRANLLANLWLASATISALIASFDGATGAGIGSSITGIAVGGRAAGLADHPNAFALTCAMTLPLALLRAVQLRGWWRAIAIGSACVLVTGVLVSGSRLGLFSVALAVGLMALMIPKLRSRIIVVAVTVAALTLLLAPKNSPLLVGFDRLSGGGDATQATGQRSDQLHDSLNIALDHPVTGVGFTVVADAHTLPVQFWETAGFLGIIAMVLFVTGVVTTGLRLRRDKRLPARDGPLLAGTLTISFAVWFISGLLQNQIADRYIYVPVGLLLGLGVAARASGARRERSEPPARPARPPATPARPAGSVIPREPERVPSHA
jgi:O-antigen ligase